MTALAAVLFVTSWADPTPPAVKHLHGFATYMARGVMDQVLANRGIVVPEGTIAVALNRKGDLGREIWIEYAGGFFHRAVSVDCASEHDYLKRLEQSYVVEVSAEEADEEGFCAEGPVPVTVYFENPYPEPKGAN
jgi:hypothetical protein